jgi:hypothetical protein
MTRIDNKLGGHAGRAPGALTKQEVAALLCRAGHQAGYWVVPEFEVLTATGERRRIDVVWAVRNELGLKSIWHPVAAFEIEGHRVAPASIAKNVASLDAAAAGGAVITAMVLFQVGPDGKPWGRSNSASSLGRASRCLKRFQSEAICRAMIEVVLDEELTGCLGGWEAALAGRASAATAPRSGARS